MNAHPERIGPYRILGKIGEGGFGQVFAGKHETLQRRAAVKVLLPVCLGDRDTVARFVREAGALEKFKGYPGIVQVQHFDRMQQPPYLAMELLEGITLRKWIVEQGSSVTLQNALALGHQIASTMVHVHAMGFVHRDLKPENIMLVHDDAAPLGLRPVILDFGIAKITFDGSFDDQSVTHVKTTGTNILGSLKYMSPEQIADADNVTVKADVYTLGILVYELLSGKPPFVSEGAIELACMHRRDPPMPLHIVEKSVAPVLSAFITSMLAKKPEDRPSMRDCEVMFGRDFSLDQGKCPFPGLQPFNDSLAHLFFGRSAETDFIRGKLAELREASTRRWLQIQGSSGAGKSSFVHAAIVPKLDPKQWSIIKMRPGEDPIRSLVEALTAVYGANAKELAEALRQRPEALHDFILEHVDDDKRILLVIDQFEELFALGGAHIETLERILRHALQNPDSPLRLLTTIRSDYLHRFDLALDLAKLLDSFAVRYDLRPMAENALSEVIDGMAKAAGLRLANGLTRRMVQDASGNDYRLPLVGHALRSLWALKDTGEITHADYEEMGGVGGALTKQAKELLESESLGTGGREAAKWMLLDLVQVGQGAPDTRRPRTRAELEKAVGKSEDALRAWKCLSGEEATGSGREPFRLLVTSGDAADSAVQRVELVHEMVLHKVPLVVEWINAERDFLELIAALESAALEWQKADKKDGLPSGTLLLHYRGGKDAVRRARVLRMASEGAREFLNEALRVEKRKRHVQIGIGALLVMMMFAIAMSAAVAVHARRRAEENRDAVLKMTNKIINDVDWELGWRPYTSDIRNDMLSDLDRELGKLEERDPSAVYRSLVEVKLRRSEFARKHETLETTYEFLKEAKRPIDDARDKNPNDLESQWLFAMYLSKHGKATLAQGKYDGAFGAFKRSVDILEDLEKKNYPDFGKQALATSQLECGDAEFYRGRAKEALDWYKKALVIRMKGDGPDEAAYWSSMVNEARIRIARAESKLGDNAGARATLDKAFEQQFPLVKQEPYNVLHSFHLAHIELELGKIDQAEGKWFAAAEHFGQAWDIAERIGAGDTRHKEYALLRIEALAGLEKTRHEIGDLNGEKEAKARRCEIIKDFAGRDKQDRRFDPGGCN